MEIDIIPTIKQYFFILILSEWQITANKSPMPSLMIKENGGMTRNQRRGKDLDPKTDIIEVPDPGTTDPGDLTADVGTDLGPIGNTGRTGEIEDPGRYQSDGITIRIERDLELPGNTTDLGVTVQIIIESDREVRIDTIDATEKRPERRGMMINIGDLEKE